MNPEVILALTVRLLKIARLKGTDPERIAFLERDVARMTAEVARSNPRPPAPTVGEAPALAHAVRDRRDLMARIGSGGRMRVGS